MSAKQSATWILIAALTLGLEAAATHPGRPHRCIFIARDQLMFSVTRKNSNIKKQRKWQNSKGILNQQRIHGVGILMLYCCLFKGFIQLHDIISCFQCLIAVINRMVLVTMLMRERTKCEKC